jgi:type IV secretion system protein VirB8
VIGSRTKADLPAKTESGHGDARTWEAKRILSVEQSARRAWLAAGGMGVVAVSMAVAIAVMLPLKTTDVRVVRVDQSTGYVDYLTTATSTPRDVDMVLDDHFLDSYVRSYETYDWYVLQQDYDRIGLYSSPSVGKEYAAKFSGSQDLTKAYGSSWKESVEILSISRSPSSDSIANIRFRKTKKRVDDQGPGESRVWLAVIAFTKKPSEKAPESIRRLNPLGFTVTSYRAYPEAAGGAK